MKRDKTLSVMLTEAEYEAVKIQADKAERPMSTYARILIRKAMADRNAFAGSYSLPSLSTVPEHRHPAEDAASERQK